MVQGSDILLIIVCILFPPAAVAFITGCSCDLLINVLLTLLGYIPGHIHGLYIIWKRIKAEETYGRHGYTYLGNGEFVGNGPAVGSQAPPPPHQQYYGSTN
ncbi:hypothetical protein BD324DRAFT_614691 [Kockovaella imperatae]|uniref:Uncharacterized protein n=1 Tax=Kockovaella imperatae TaxID=4999 RepID=A0A1Y1UNU7_9TREE|nr:hypothetical protein BD324DRAFT_614691 [Kockovaella imperatae]ORX39711.1 hypothetical protein BD324DRAFT_614691 [Kockovaella imperatae]